MGFDTVKPHREQEHFFLVIRITLFVLLLEREILPKICNFIVSIFFY